MVATTSSKEGSVALNKALADQVTMEDSTEVEDSAAQVVQVDSEDSKVEGVVLEGIKEEEGLEAMVDIMAEVEGLAGTMAVGEGQADQEGITEEEVGAQADQEGGKEYI